jgi:hypothetical protein
MSLLVNQAAKCGSAKRACENDTLIGTMIDQLPTFGIIVSVTEGFAEFCF